MFAVIPGQHSVILQSATCSAEILPTCGAILNRWTLNNNGSSTELIDGYESVDDFEANCEAKGFRSAKLSPYVCRMNGSAYEFGGRHYDIGKFKLNGTAIHGLVYNNPFELVESSANQDSASVLLRHHYDGSDAGFPFTYTIDVKYLLELENRLTITTTVTNTHDSTIPMADGWHPYFSLGCPVNELQFSMQVNNMLEFNDALIPTGNMLPFESFRQPELLGTQFFDNCFSLKQPLNGAACELTNPATGLTLAIYPDASYPYLQVYTPPHRNSIAIENLSAAPDAFNNHLGLLHLEPGETRAFTTVYAAGF